MHLPLCIALVSKLTVFSFPYTPTQAELFLSIWLQASRLTVFLVLHKAFWTHFLLRKQLLATTPTCHMQRNKSEASMLAVHSYYTAISSLVHMNVPLYSHQRMLLYSSLFISPVFKNNTAFKKYRLAMFM